MSNLPINNPQLTTKEKLGGILCFLILTGLIIWCFWCGVSGLFLSTKHPMENVFKTPIPGDMYEGQIVYASKYPKALSRQIRYRWTGTEYYYIAYSQDMDRAIFVRAPKNWSKNWKDDLSEPVYLPSNGIVRNLRYNVKTKLSGRCTDLQNEGIQIRSDIYLDIFAKRICWLQLFLGIGLCACVIYYSLLLKRLNAPDAKPIFKPLLTVMLILPVVLFICFLYLRHLT